MHDKNPLDGDEKFIKPWSLISEMQNLIVMQSSSNSEEVEDRIRLIYIGIIFGVPRLITNKMKMFSCFVAFSTYC